MPNGWRILIACMVLWPACSDGRDHITILEFLYCYMAVQMYSGWWYFTARVLERMLIIGLPTFKKGKKKKFFFTSGAGLESFPWELPIDRVCTVPKIWGKPCREGNSRSS